MKTITLRDNTTPERAEAAVWSALADVDDAVRVRVHGFPTAALNAILGRLPAGWTPFVNPSGTQVRIVRQDQPAVETPETARRGGGLPQIISSVTANIMSNPLMSKARAKADIEKVAKTVRGHGGIIGWQEIHGTYKPMVNGLAGFDTYYHPGLESIPISWESGRFEMVKAGGHIVVKGRSRRDAPGVPTPNRGNVWVLLRDKRTGRLVVKVNSHFINKAWNGREKNKAALAFRRQEWQAQADDLRGLLDTLEERFKVPIIGAGDMNRTGDFLGSLAKDNTPARAIDKLYHRGRITPVRGRVIALLSRLFSDHDARVQEYHL